MGRTPTQIELSDGFYIFDKENMRRIYEQISSKNWGAHLIEQLTERVCNGNISEYTVKDWLQGKYGPTEREAVQAIADFFGRNIHNFLILVKRKGTDMKNISEAEKGVARKVYGEMLEMLQLLEWEDPDPQNVSIKIRHEKTGYFKNQEEAREHYLLEIKKSSLDLPAWMRSELTDLVNTCFGEWDADYNNMYLNSPDYKEYLQKADLTDTVDNRIKYSCTFCGDVSKKLDEIFKDYICI